MEEDFAAYQELEQQEDKQNVYTHRSSPAGYMGQKHYVGPGVQVNDLNPQVFRLGYKNDELQQATN